MRLEVGELRVNSQAGRHGSGRGGAEGLSQGVGCVSSGMDGMGWDGSREVCSPWCPHRDGSPVTLWKRELTEGRRSPTTYRGVMFDKDEDITFYNQREAKAHIVLKDPLWDLLHLHLYSNRYVCMYCIREYTAYEKSYIN